MCVSVCVCVCVCAAAAARAGPQQASAGGSVLCLRHAGGGGLHGAGALPGGHSAGVASLALLDMQCS